MAKLVKDINWLDPKMLISKYFTVHDALYLPAWDKYATCTDTEKQNILNTAEVMDKVREFLGKPIIVHCWLRSVEYNKNVKGAVNSEHLKGKAVDFHAKDLNCDIVRAKLISELDRLKICVENLASSDWVHIDIGEPRKYGGRYFRP